MRTGTYLECQRMRFNPSMYTVYVIDAICYRRGRSAGDGLDELADAREALCMTHSTSS